MWDGHHYKCTTCGEVFSERTAECPFCHASCVQLEKDGKPSPLRFSCPQCKSELVGELSWVGSIAECPSCSYRFLVSVRHDCPNLSSGENKKLGDAKPPIDSRIPCEKNPKKGKLIFVGSILAVVLMCFVLAELRDRSKVVEVGEFAIKMSPEEAKCYERALGGDATAQYELAKLIDPDFKASNDRAVEAFKWAMKSAQQGNADGENYVGCCYIGGHGVSSNSEEGVKWQLKAMEHGSLKAKANMGLNYLQGRGVAKDHVKAFEYTKEAAEAGLGFAQASLGRMYFAGKGTVTNMTEAVKWFDSASRQNDPGAKVMLGLCYMNGDGVDKDVRQAIEFFEDAMKIDKDCLAAGLLGRAYSNIGDYAKSRKWLEFAIEHESQSAVATPIDQYELLLAMIHLKGLSEKTDKRRGVSLLMDSAKRGNLLAMEQVAEACELGTYWTKDVDEAYQRYVELKNKGSKFGTLKVATCLWNGVGVACDKDRAAEMINNLAADGYDRAQVFLGKIYYLGDFLPKDYHKAFTWFEKAAEQNSGEADCMMGVCYYEGKGVTCDYANAKECFERAAKRGCAQGAACMGDLYRNGNGVKRNKALARKWYEKAIKMGWTQAGRSLEELERE